MGKGFIGIDAFRKHCKSLQNQVTGDGLRAAVSRQAKMVQAEAKMLCPVNNGELRSSIMTQVEERGRKVIGTVYTNEKHAVYVEMGTGPVGEAHHEGISPEVNPVYVQHGWGIPADEVDASDAEKYKWPRRTYHGKDYYMTSGQPAHPFLYPALKNNEKRAADGIRADLKKAAGKGRKK